MKTAVLRRLRREAISRAKAAEAELQILRAAIAEKKKLLKKTVISLAEDAKNPAYLKDDEVDEDWLWDLVSSAEGGGMSTCETNRARSSSVEPALAALTRQSISFHV